jgi:hypothetical protein
MKNNDFFYLTLTPVKYKLKRKIIWGYRPWSFLNHFRCFLYKNNEKCTPKKILLKSDNIFF